MILMKALRSFGTQRSNEGHVRRGREFSVAHETRAKDLEESGLAYRLATKMAPPVLNKMEPPAENKAATAGPLDIHGGETGAETASSSSDQDPAPRRRRSKKQEGGLDL